MMSTKAVIRKEWHEVDKCFPKAFDGSFLQI